MKTFRGILFGVLFSVIGFWGPLYLIAQTPVTKPALSVPEATPKVEALTELEQALQQNVTLQKALTQYIDQLAQCQAQLAPAQSKQNAEAVSKIEADLKERIEKAHPGYAYDVKTGQLTPKLPEVKK